MKKLFALLTVLALLLPVLAGCQSANPLPPQNSGASATGTTPPETTQPVVTPPETTAPVATPTEITPAITADQAVAIALKDAGLKKDEIRDLDVELDRDGGTLHYDVDFEKANKDYDYEIHAETGKILKKDVPAQVKPASTTTTTKPKQLTKTEAKNIALKHAGLSANQVRDLEVELDRDDGTLHFDVSFDEGGYDYDYEIHAETGKILKSEKEKD